MDRYWADTPGSRTAFIVLVALVLVAALLLWMGSRELGGPMPPDHPGDLHGSPRCWDSGASCGNMAYSTAGGGGTNYVTWACDHQVDGWDLRSEAVKHDGSAVYTNWTNGSGTCATRYFYASSPPHQHRTQTNAAGRINSSSWSIHS